MRKDDAYLHAFNRAFSEFYRPICFFANGIIDDWEQSKSIVSALFLKFYGEGKPFGTKRIKNLLYKAVENDCKDFIRHKKREDRNFQQYVDDYHPEVEPAFSDELILAQFMKELYEEIEKLPDQYRETIKSIYLKGMTAKELAQLLKIAQATVYANKRKGLAKLREWLRKSNIRF